MAQEIGNATNELNNKANQSFKSAIKIVISIYSLKLREKYWEKYKLKCFRYDNFSILINHNSIRRGNINVKFII